MLRSMPIGHMEVYTADSIYIWSVGLVKQKSTICPTTLAFQEIKNENGCYLVLLILILLLSNGVSTVSIDTKKKIKREFAFLYSLT